MAESPETAPESRGKVLDRPLLGIEGRSLVVEGVDGAFDGTHLVNERLDCVVIG